MGDELCDLVSFSRRSGHPPTAETSVRLVCDRVDNFRTTQVYLVCSLWLEALYSSDCWVECFFIQTSFRTFLALPRIRKPCHSQYAMLGTSSTCRCSINNTRQRVNSASIHVSCASRMCILYLVHGWICVAVSCDRLPSPGDFSNLQLHRRREILRAEE
jgi:hypothetical protein